MEPENDGLEDDFPFNWVIFMFHVYLPGCSKFLHDVIFSVWFLHLPAGLLKTIWHK